MSDEKYKYERYRDWALGETHNIPEGKKDNIAYWSMLISGWRGSKRTAMPFRWRNLISVVYMIARIDRGSLQGPYKNHCLKFSEIIPLCRWDFLIFY